MVLVKHWAMDMISGIVGISQKISIHMERKQHNLGLLLNMQYRCIFNPLIKRAHCSLGQLLVMHYRTLDRCMFNPLSWLNNLRAHCSLGQLLVMHYRTLDRCRFNPLSWLNNQFGTAPSHALSNPGSMHVQPPQLAQQPGGTSQFTTTPNHAKVNPGSMNLQPAHWPQQQELNPGSMNFQPAQWTQQQGGTSQFATTPNHAEVNSGSMNVQPHQWAQQQAGALQFGTAPSHALSNPGSMQVQPPQLAQQPAGTLHFGTPPSHALSNPGSMHVQPPQLAQQPAGALQFGTAPSHALSNPGSMHVQPPQLAQQPGTSQSSNITNADAEKEARIRESKRKSWVKKEKERRENAEKVAELTKQMNDLREVIASLEKEGVKGKIKQKNSDQIISDLNEEVTRLTNEKKIQTMQVAVLSEIVVASPEATDVAQENTQLKRKIELLTTASNNPDIIKTVELQEENEKLTRELKKLRLINNALCNELSKDEQ